MRRAHYLFPELDYATRELTLSDTRASASFRPHFKQRPVPTELVALRNLMSLRLRPPLGFHFQELYQRHNVFFLCIHDGPLQSKNVGAIEKCCRVPNHEKADADSIGILIPWLFFVIAITVRPGWLIVAFLVGVRHGAGQRDACTCRAAENGCQGLVPIAKSHEMICSTAIGSCLKCGWKPTCALTSASGLSGAIRILQQGAA